MRNRHIDNVEHALVLKNISKSFHEKTVLSQLDLAVPYGSVFAFLGNNGEGKSTTIRVLTGLESPDQGIVSICGLPLYVRRSRLLSRTSRFVPDYSVLTNLGGLIDAPSLYPNLTATEFLSIGCRIKQLRKTEIARVLSIVSLSDVATKTIGAFSLGMKQRLAIAHTLLGNPRLLILDEPTNGLDPSGIRDIRQLLSELPAKTGTTVFFSTHNLDEVEKMASRFAVLKDGRIRFESSIDAWKAAQQLNMIIEVSNAKRANETLLRQAFNSQIIDATSVRVNQLTRQQQPHIHSTLVAEGVDIFQSHIQKRTLEQWFTDENTH